MKRLSNILLGLSLVFGAAFSAAAQEKSEGMHTPPPVLTIVREMLKPGKSGSPHARTESMFVKAMSGAKSPSYYLGMDSMTGKSRSLFFTGYESFAAWEKDLQSQQKNPTLSAALDRASVADGELLESYEESVWVYRADQSYNQNSSLAGIRYFELEVFSVKPGHEEDWNAAVKLVKDAYAKGMPEAHWAMYQLVDGGPTPAFLVITPRKSLEEIDTAFADGHKFMDAIGADGMKKLNDLTAGSISETETNMFAINPAISYMDEALAKADPDFWGHKSMPAPAPKKEKAEPKP
jgi:hypothetical protein